MSNSNDQIDTDDPFDLNRFVEAQRFKYQEALSEIIRGQKMTHWMWFIFPQIDGLGSSPTSKHYAIKGLDEAKAYLGQSILGPRLIECAEAVLNLEGRSAKKIFGSPDDLKLRSCATLFASVQPSGSLFHRILRRYFGGAPDRKTLELLGIDGDNETIHNP